MRTRANEVKLLKRCLEGDTKAFEVIIAKYQELVCAITYSGISNVQKSEELAHQTFINAWNKLSQLGDLYKFRPWLCSIARNHVKSFIRTNKRDILQKAKPMEYANGTSTEESGPLESAITKEHMEIVDAAVGQIPEQYREPLVLYYRQHQSVRQVAQSLDLSEELVKKRLQRGRKMIKEQISSIVEKTLSATGPKKAFATAVIASITGMAVKSGVSAAAGIATASSATGTATGVAGVMSGVAAKIITTVAVVAIGVGIKVTYTNLQKEDIGPELPIAVTVVQEEVQAIEPPLIEEMETEKTKGSLTNTSNSGIPAKIVSNQTVAQETLKTVNSDLQKKLPVAVFDEEAGRLINVYVTDKQTSKPIEKATVYTRGGRDPIGTDKNGRCQLRWDSDKDRIMPVWARKNGYVRMSYSIRKENTPGDKPIEIGFALDKGTAIGGVVKDSNGENLRGVELTIRVNDDEHMGKPENHVRKSVTTDENGRWEFGGVPNELEAVSLKASHASSAETNTWAKTAEDIQLLRNKEYVLVIDEGYSIFGTVKDELGNLILGARIQLGDWYGMNDSKHRTITDVNGRFEFNYLTQTDRLLEL